jgi:hypothetical protein
LEVGEYAVLNAVAGEDNANDAAMLIAKAFWEKLRSELPRVQ